MELRDYCLRYQSRFKHQHVCLILVSDLLAAHVGRARRARERERSGKAQRITFRLRDVDVCQFVMHSQALMLVLMCVPRGGPVVFYIRNSVVAGSRKTTHFAVVGDSSEIHNSLV